MKDLNKLYIDVVYCVDLTYVTTQTLNKIKNSILALHTDVSIGYNYRHYPSLTPKMRIKVIGYSNGCDENSHMFEATNFFSIPEEEDKLKQFLNSFEIKGNKNGTNHSLESLALAMQSDWCTPTFDYSIRTIWHCIFIITGTSQALPTKLYSKLVDLWLNDTNISAGMNQHFKRLAVIAPESSDPWTDLIDDFDNCWILFTDENKDVDNKLSYLHSNLVRFFDEDICF